MEKKDRDFIICSASLCDIILDDCIETLIKSPNAPGTIYEKDENIINAIKHIGLEKQMVLYHYEDDEKIEFTIVSTKLKRHIHIKTIFNHEKEEVHITVDSNIDFKNFVPRK